MNCRSVVLYWCVSLTAQKNQVSIKCPVHFLFLISITLRKKDGERWFPDARHYQEMKHIVLYPDEEHTKWKIINWNDDQIAPAEKQIRNMVINFGPQHPAAHGVLRLVLELDGEVCIDYK